MLARHFFKPNLPRSIYKLASAASEIPNISIQMWSVKSYETRHSKWPYSVADFTRSDESNDDFFYSEPRFVTHIDANAIRSLRSYYDHTLPEKGRILDFCSSWTSHYPPRIHEAVEEGELEVIGMGMNLAELEKNLLLKGAQRSIVQDLNTNPNIRTGLPAEDLDAATCVVSIDYLTNPKEVLHSLRAATKKGGFVHLVVSNRCFPTKAVKRWLEVDEDERLLMVGGQ